MSSKKNNKKPVRILTDKGKSIVEISEIYKKGSNLWMKGKLMGKFPTSMFLSTGDFFRILAMVLKPGILSFLLLSPFYWAREKLNASKKGNK